MTDEQVLRDMLCRMRDRLPLDSLYDQSLCGQISGRQALDRAYRLGMLAAAGICRGERLDRELRSDNFSRGYVAAREKCIQEIERAAGE